MTRLFTVALSACLLLTVNFATAHASGSDSKEDSKNREKNAVLADEQYNEGVEHMQKARQIAIVGDSAFAYNYRATADAKANRAFEKAVTNFESAAKLNPKLKEAFNNLGYCYRKLGKLEESLKSYDRAIKLDTAFEQAREYRGETYLAMGELKKAEAEFDFLTELESPYADSLAKAIELFKLSEFSKQLKESSGGN